MICYQRFNVFGLPLIDHSQTPNGECVYSVKREEGAPECCTANDNTKRVCRHHIPQYDEFAAWVEEVRDETTHR